MLHMTIQRERTCRDAAAAPVGREDTAEGNIMHRKSLASAAIFSALTTATLFAQSYTASVRGVVTDSSHAAIPEAQSAVRLQPDSAAAQTQLQRLLAARGGR